MPLSAIQRRLWFLWQLEPDSLAYLMPLVLRLHGPADTSALVGAARDLVARHEPLRTVVAERDGEPVAEVRPAEAVPVTVTDLDPAGPPLPELLAAHARRPFALDAEPPCRVLVVRVSDDDHAVALTLHHIASDGRSQDLLLQDLAALYAARLGLRAPPPQPRLQYGDVARWQHCQRDAGAEAAALRWWTTQLAGVPPVLALPTDRPRPADPEWTAGTIPVALPDRLTEALRERAAGAGATPFMVMMAAMQALLARLSGTDDVPVGMPEAGRAHPDTEQVVGCFLNTLVVRGDLSGNPTGTELLHRVRDQVLGAMAHAAVPFEQIVAAVAPERSLGATPLYQVQLNLYDASSPARFPGLRSESSYTPLGVAKFDLALELADTGRGTPIRGTLEYRTELFDETTAARLRDWFLTLLAGMLADLDRPVSEIALAPVSAPALAGAACDYGTDSLPSRFAQQVERCPDTVAVVAPDATLTYAELDRRANQLAHQLRAAGVGTDQPVGVILPPSVDLAAAILGVLKAGAAYLPIDPWFPPHRIRQMLAAAGARFAIADAASAAHLAGTGVTKVSLDRLDRQPGYPPPVVVDQADLAHVIFTSGSTGQPKGVAVPHRGIVNCVAGMLAHEPSLAGRSFAVVSTIAADLGLACFYGALLSGGTLHLLDRETATDPAAYAHYLATHPVDVIKCVPSHLSMLAAHGELAQVLPRHLLILAGEAVPWPLVDQVRAARPGLRVHTHYGPTESSMFSLICDVDEVAPQERHGVVPLGGILPNITAHVLDRAGRPLPAGVPGELALSGPGVSRGYVNEPELTAAQFVPDPIEPTRRCYRTGDLVRVHPDSGTVSYLGRADDQVKIRGHRVELAEVASACRSLPGVTDAVVLPVGQAHERRLAAWVAAPAGVDPAAVRASLRELLPDYQVPATVQVLAALPLTANGKVDRAALPATPAAQRTDHPEVVPPRTRYEELVASAWQEVLGLARVGIDDDFFALGGHSFAATRVVGRLRRALGHPVPLRLLFERPVLADLAAALATASPPAGTELAAIPRRDPGEPTPLSPVQARLWFLAQLEPDSPAYHIPLLLRLRGELQVAALAGAVRDLAERHEVLRSVVRSDPDGTLTAHALASDQITLPVREVAADELTAAAQELATRPFRLDREPPLRAVLLRTGEREHALSLTFHHLAVDGWAVDLAGAELAALYSARVGSADPPPLPRAQYGDYAAWQQTAAPTPPAEVQWWAQRLADAPPRLELPYDRPRPPVATTSGAKVPVALPPPLARQLRSVAQQVGGTAFMILLATWQAFLSRLAGTHEIVVGVPVSGRHHPDTESMLGCFVNTLPMRTRIAAAEPVRQLLARVRDEALDAFAHSGVPFEQVVEQLQPDRDPSSTPVFQVMLNVLEDHAPAPDLPGLECELLVRPETATKYDLNLGLYAEGGTYRGALSYRTDLFDPETVGRWVEWYLAMLADMLADLDRPVGTFPLAPVTAPLLAGPPRQAGSDEPVVRAVERTVDRCPDAPAVVGADGQLTYRELDQRANRLAHALLAAGVAAGQPVAVLLEPGCDLLVSLLAIHKAGAGYLPFDAAFPAARIATMRSAAQAQVVLTVREFADRAGEHALLLDDPATLAGYPDHRPSTVVTAGDLSHIVFTSGSTGVPKGVAVTHASLASYFAGALPRLGDDVAGGSYAMVSTPAADLGLTAMLAPLLTGGTAHLIAREVATDPEALASYLRRHRVDVLKCVPTHLELLAAHGDLSQVLPRRLLILTGEALSWDLVARVRAAQPGLRVQNHYGHTESTLSSFICDPEEVPAAHRHGSVPLGTPLPGVQAYLVDQTGRPVPPGVPGELWLSGPGVSRGYVADEALTAERFVPDPITGTTRCYRSGDLAVVQPDGRLCYRGRIDDQVKIRGHRVELGEVVAGLRAVAGVADAVALPAGEGHQRTLVAWVVPQPGTVLDPAAVRADLRTRLPDQLVPAAIVPLPRLPLNANGKLDRAALPAPDTAAAAAEHSPAATPTEQHVAAVWQRMLAVTRVGREDDFFALGGDSFTAVRAVREIDPALRVIDLFTHPVLRDLAAYLDARTGADGTAAAPDRLLHRLTGPDAAALTVVCVPYGGGLAAAYRPLAEELTRGAPDTAVLAVELPGHDPARPDERPQPIPQVVDRLAAELAATVTGPVLLYGHCVGSAVALALARRLEAMADGPEPFPLEVVGVVLAGGFPSARLPGRVPAFFNRAFGTDRWASQRTFRDALRALGGIVDDMDEASTRTMLASMRHDSREARAWYTQQLAAPGPRLRAPALCLVGERDPVTEFHQERYREWGAFAERVSLAVVPHAGHYFLKHQPAQVAELLLEAVRQWRTGRLPRSIDADEVPVTGQEARDGLRSFYLLATGQMVALVGWALSNFALGFWAFLNSGRVSDYALVVMLALVPTALLSPVGGAIADRFDRRKVMISAHVVVVAATGALFVLLVTDSLALWSVCLIVGATSMVTALHQPAYLAAIAQLVPKPYLPQANAVAQMGLNLSQLVAPLAGGALIALLGLAPVIALNAVTFVLGIATLWMVRLPNRMFRRVEEPFRSAVAGGWRFLAKRRPLLLMLGYFMVVNFFTAIMWVSVAPMVLPLAGAAALGVVTAIGWAGAILGGLAVVPWGGTRRRTIGMLAFTVVSGLGMVMMGVAPVLAVVAIGFAIRLASMAVINVHWLALIQVKVGHELQGRVLAMNLMLVLSMQPLGFMIAGPLADRVFEPLVSEGGALAGTVGQVIGVGPGRGMALMLVCAGLLLAAWGVLGLLFRPMRLLEDRVPDAVPPPEVADDLDLIQAEADRKITP